MPTDTRALERSSSAAALDTPEHDEWLIDESIEETFPASDATTPVRPGSIMSVRYAVARGNGAANRALAIGQRIARSRLFWIAIGCVASIVALTRHRAR